MDEQKMLEAYLRGKPLKQISQEFQVNYSALRTLASREKWAARKAARPENAIMDTADLLLQKLRDTLEADEKPQSQSLRQYTATLKDLMRIRGVRHEADIREQEARIERLRRDAQGEGNTLQVILSPGMEEWSK